MTEITVPIKPPPIPSKFDIIPIHASDRGTFKRCRRKWDWSSPMRRNLQPNVEMMRPDKNLWFGTGIHYALAQYYNPTLRRDPIETFLWWWELQMKGGYVIEEELELTYELSPRRVNNDPSTMYHVRGLYDLLPDSDYEVYEEYRE